MDENKVRNISLIIIAIEVLVFYSFLLYVTNFGGLSNPMIKGESHPEGYFVWISIPVIVGLLIIGSAYSKKLFYVITLIEILIVFYPIITSGFAMYKSMSFVTPIFLIIILAPQLIYYIWLLQNKIRTRRNAE